MLVHLQLRIYCRNTFIRIFWPTIFAPWMTVRLSPLTTSSYPFTSKSVQASWSERNSYIMYLSSFRVSVFSELCSFTLLAFFCAYYYNSCALVPGMWLVTVRRIWSISFQPLTNFSTPMMHQLQKKHCLATILLCDNAVNEQHQSVAVIISWTQQLTACFPRWLS